MVFSFSQQNNSNWDASLKNDGILNNWGFSHRDQLTVVAFAAASPVSSAVVLFFSTCRNLKMESVGLNSQG